VSREGERRVKVRDSEPSRKSWRGAAVRFKSKRRVGVPCGEVAWR
jgi:hypothetical protein